MKKRLFKASILGILMALSIAPPAQAQTPVSEAFAVLPPRLEDAQFHPQMRISADVESPQTLGDSVTVYSASLIPLLSACDLSVFTASEVVKEDPDPLMGAMIYDFADGSWINMTDKGSTYYFGVDGMRCSRMLDRAGDYAVEWSEDFPVPLEEAEAETMEQARKMGIPHCVIANRTAYANEKQAFFCGQIQLKQVIDGVPFVQSLLHLTATDTFVVGNMLLFTRTQQGFQIINVMGAYENCEPLYQVEEITPLPEAVETLRTHMDTFFAKMEGIPDLEVFKIAFEYVPYRTNPWEEDAAEYELIPVWHFCVKYAEREKDVSSYDFCVSAIDGKMLVY